MTYQEEKMLLAEEEEKYKKFKEQFLNENLSKKEPMPVVNTHPAVWDLVIKDIRDRDEFGTKKYNTRLQPFNGRNVLVDLYQELLDAVVYIRQLIYEQEHLDPTGPIREEVAGGGGIPIHGGHGGPDVYHIHKSDGSDCSGHPNDPYHCACGSYFHETK